MTTSLRFRRCAGSALIALACACSGDSTGPGPDPEDDGEGPEDGGGNATALLLSDVTTAPVAVPSTRQSAVRVSVTYVSLQSGRIPRGASVRITNLESGAAAESPMIDGGFDPVPLPAVEGDEIEIIATDSGGATHAMKAKVPPRRPPVVVRTSPPRGRIDVALNSIVIIVFSEPIPSIGTDGVRLVRDGLTIPASVQLRDGGLRAELTPEDELEPNARYEVVVAEDVEDGSGEPLGQPFTSDFVTSTVRVASISIEPGSGTWPAGSLVTLRAIARDEDGSEIAGAQLAWTSLASDVALSEAGPGTFRSVGYGDAVIEAHANGVSARATISFVPLVFTSVAAGGSHTCAVAEGSLAYCWGSGDEGQVRGRWTTRPVLQGSYPQIAAGPGHTCAADAASVTCWGRRMGLGNVKRPDYMPGTWPQPLLQLDLGAWAHSCGVGADSKLLCWGRIDEAEAGGVVATAVSGPVPVQGGTVYTAAGSGGNFFCGLQADGGVRCAGANEFGQLGVGHYYPERLYFDTQAEMELHDAMFRSYPVLGAIRFTSITVGNAHACGLTDSGEAWCWGDNRDGQLGAAACDSDRGGLCLRSAQPVPVVGGVRFRSLSAGDAFTCGVSVDARLYCWGRNDSGQLGNGSTAAAREPRPVVTVYQAFESVSAGGAHACAIAGGTQGRTVVCWGNNSRGQLGDGTTSPAASPRAVALQP